MTLSISGVAEAEAEPQALGAEGLEAEAVGLLSIWRLKVPSQNLKMMFLLLLLLQPQRVGSAPEARLTH